MNKKPDRILLHFPVLWEGWECDSEAWIMERSDKTRYLRMTNHGSKFEAKPAQLLERIDEYKRVIEKSYEALRLLGVEL